MDEHSDTATFKFKYVDTSSYRAAHRFQTEKSCKDSKAVNLADFVATVPFTHFVTLDPHDAMSIVSVTGKVSLKVKVKEIITRIEKYIKAPVSYVVGYESEPEVHCHLCLCSSSARLARETIFLSLLKQFNYDIGNLDLYLKTPTNRHERRRLKRHNLRLQHV